MTSKPRGSKFGRKFTITAWAIAILAIGNVVGVLAQSQFPEIERRIWRELLPWGQNTGPNGEVIWNAPEDLNNVGTSFVLNDNVFDEYGDRIYSSAVPPGWTGLPGTPINEITPYGWDEPSAVAAAAAQFPLLSVGQCTFSHRGDYDLVTGIYWPQVRICKGPNGEELPPPTGKLLNPVGLAIDGTNVYVSDGYNHRIQVYDFYGRVKAIDYPIGNGVPGAGEFDYGVRYPSLYTANSTVANGGYKGHQLSAPYGILLDGVTYSGTGPVPPARRLLIADSGNSRVAIFNTDGTPSYVVSGQPVHADIPTPLDSNGLPLGSEAFKPDQIAISPGATVRAPGTPILPGDPDELKRIVVVDRLKCWVAILDLGFNVVKTLPEDNPLDSQHDACLDPEDNVSAPGEFSTVINVKVDGSGNIYIADHSQNVVQVFDPMGNHVTWIGKPGGSNPGGQGDLQGPVGLLIDQFGRLGVIDEGNARAVFYGLDNGPAAVTFEFQLDTTVAVDDFPMGIEMQIGPVSQGLDPKGRILVTDPVRRRVLRFELPDLVIANLTANQDSLTTTPGGANEGVGEFDVVVPKQKVGAVTGVTVTIVADPINIIVGTPTPSSPVTIAPGQVVHYTFPYTLPPGETRATFTVKAQGTSGTVPVVTPELSDTVRLRCANCTASHVVYPLPAPVSGPPGAPAVLFPSYSGNGDWYDREVYVRITPTGSIPATHIGWYYEGDVATALADEDTHETPIGPGGFVDVPFRIEGRSLLHYWPISASGEGDPTPVILNVDLIGPEVNFQSWTPTTHFDGAGQPWYRTAGVGANVVPEVVGNYIALDSFSGPRAVNGLGSVRFTQEGRNQGVPINEPDYTNHAQVFDSINATDGRGVNIDNTAPVFTGSATTVTVYMSGEDAQGRYVDAAPGLLVAYPTDPLLGAQPGSGVNPGTSILSNPAATYRHGDTFTFTATDYAGNSSTHTITVLLTSAVLVGPRSERITFGQPTPPFVPVVTQALPPGVVITQMPTCYVTAPHVNSGLYRIDCTGGSITNAEFIYGWSDYVIDKARPVVTVTGGTFIYNGAARPATCSVAGVLGAPLTASSFTYSSGAAPVNVGSYSATCDIAESANYVAESGTGNIVIDKATPVVTILGGPFDYDGTLHPATCTVAGVAGQTLTGAITYAAGSAPRDATAGAAATCSFDGTANYNAVSANRSLVVNPRPITITAQAKTKLIGASDPALTFTITSGSLVAGDSISGSLTRTPGEGVGTLFAITQGTLTAGPNYIVTFVPANLNILPLNLPPVAVDNTASGVGAAPLTINVLSGDSDPDGGTLSLTGITQPTGGATVGVVTTSGNLVIFTPAPGFVGTATFTYTISDGQGGVATANVTVTITASSCVTGTIALNATSGSTSGSAGNIRTFTGAGVSVKASGFSRVKSSGTWNTAFLGAYGSAGLGVTDGSEGSGSNDTHKLDNIGDRFNYILFEFSQPVVVTKAFLDYVGSDSDATIWIGTKADPFTNHLTLSDALLTSLGAPQTNATTSAEDRWATLNASSVTANVIVIAADVADATPEDSFKIAKLDLACATPNAPPTVTASNRSNDEGAAVSVQIVGSDPDADDLTYTATGLPSGLSMNVSTGLITGTLGYSSAGTYNVSVTVTDEDGLTSTATFVWTVANKNRPPTVSPADRTDTKGATVSFQLTGNDPDGDAITYTATGLPPGASLSTAGLMTGTLTTAGTYSVAVTVKDPSNLTGSGTFTWIVKMPNRAPTVTAADRTTTKGTAVSVQITGTDLDGDALTYSATGLPTGLSINSAGLITGTPTATGTFNVTVTVKDPSNATGTATFCWTIKAANRAPTVTASNRTDNKGATISLQMAGTDLDGDAITYTATGLPGGLTMSSTGKITGTLTTAGTFNVTVTVKDPSNTTGTATFCWTVKTANAAPDAKNDTLSTTKNNSKTISVIANDTDANGDTLSITAVTQPSKGTVVKYSNGTIKYTPPSNWYGTTSFTYTISDGKGGSDTATVSVTVSSHNDGDGCNNNNHH